ncbi:MAG: 2OG-Fe(II) oxygenase [Proteobacteria bacterium]|nr:2OG-Fe(II) oxygenase [Pseudomonadota bacterium]NBP13259.1 2OG-Fe(II) oxygenase [bacterium]
MHRYILLVLLVMLLLVGCWQSLPFANHQQVFIYPGFLTHSECDELIRLSESNLQPSKVYSSEEDNTNETHRKSDQCWLKDQAHPIIQKISKKAAEICGKPVENGELLQVVRYPEGGFFNPHYDACVGDKTFCERMNSAKSGGPRYLTLLVYLNDDFSGGETSFPKLRQTIVPKKGTAIAFYNTDAKGNVLWTSIHGGNPVKLGSKWICNKWIRLNRHYQ